MENIENYTGHDLIIATGAPGSRWSATLRVLSFNSAINRTDEDDSYMYDRIEYDDQGNKVEHGWHRGAYWGPGHQQGDKFDRLDQLSKQEILTEFMRPYTDWNTGIKIIKSHWFSYHLPLLKQLFPDAKFVANYKTDEFCYNWWHTVGGWNITYPHYHWYENNERMAKQISIENSHIREFFTVQHYTLESALSELGLDTAMPSDDEIDVIDWKLKSLTADNDKSYYDMMSMVISRNEMGIK